MDTSPVSKGKKSPRGSPRKKMAAKPKKRSLVERELETNLTNKITSPLMYTDGSLGSTSRFGRARRFKSEMDFCNPEKMMQKFSKSPKREPDVISSPVSPVYKMHASNSSVNESPKASTSTESPIKARVKIESKSPVINNSSQKKNASKIYARTDLVQDSGKDDTGKMLRNMFSPKRNTHLNNILERSSGKHSLDNPNNSQIDNSSVVKTLDFDTGKAVKNVKNTVKLQPKDELNLEKNCPYHVGDLAWARVGSYPFWPCIVSRDPYSECFVKKKAIGRLEKPHVHVIFFGDNGRRGWIPETMLRGYEGIDEFETFKEQLTSEAKKKDPKLYAAFFISEKQNTKWRVSVDEAEKFLKEPKDQRLDILNDMLIQNRGVKTTPKREKGIQLTRKSSDVSLSESLYDTLFSEDDAKPEELDNSKKRNNKQSLDVSDVVTACLDNMAAKTGITKIQKQSHMDRWLLKAKTHTPEKKVKSTTPKVKVRSVDNINIKTIAPVGNDVNKPVNKSNNKKKLRSSNKVDKKKLQIPNDEIKNDKLENTSVIEDTEHLTLNSSKCDLEAPVCNVPKICNTAFQSDQRENDLSEVEINPGCCNLDSACVDNNAMKVDDIHSLDESANEIDKASSVVESNNMTKTDANISISNEDDSRLINLEMCTNNKIVTEQVKINDTSVEIYKNNENLNSNLVDSLINDVNLEISNIAKKVNNQMEYTESHALLENKGPENINGHIRFQDVGVNVDSSINGVSLEKGDSSESQMEVTKNNELMENIEPEIMNGHVDIRDDDVSVDNSINAVSLEKSEDVNSQMEVTENNELMENEEPEHMNGHIEIEGDDVNVDNSKNTVSVKICTEVNSPMDVAENNDVIENRELEHMNGHVEFIDDDVSVDSSIIDTSCNNSAYIDKRENGDSKRTRNDVFSPEICRTDKNTNSNMENSLTNDEICKDNDISNDHLEHSENEASVETFEINQNVHSIFEHSLTNNDTSMKDETFSDLEKCKNDLAGFENSSEFDQNLRSDTQESPSKDETYKTMEITSGDLEHSESNVICMEESSIDDIKSSINNKRIKEDDSKISNSVSGHSHYNDITENGDEEYDEYSHLVPLLDNYSFTSCSKSNASVNYNNVTDIEVNLSDVSEENKESNVEKMEVSTYNAVIEECEEKSCVSKVDNMELSEKSDTKHECLDITNDESNFTKYSDTENKFYFEDDIKLYLDDDASSEGVDTSDVFETNNDAIKADVVTLENTINLNIELDIDHSNSDKSDESKNDNKNLSQKNENFKDPNFLKYVELKQDSFMDENPGLTNDDILSYLYKIWSYEQELKTVEMKNDELKESTLVKGLSESIKPKTKKPRNTSSVNKTANKCDNTTVTDQYSNRNNIATMFKNKIKKVSENGISKELQPEFGNNALALEPALPCETDESVTKCAVVPDCNEESKVSNIFPKNGDDSEKSNQSSGDLQYGTMASTSKNGYSFEFVKFLEVRQDAVLDENPNLTEDELKSYLYSTWKYEQSLKSDEMKNEDLQQLSLIKGLGPERASTATRKHKKKVYAINEDSDEDAPILKNKTLEVIDESDEDAVILEKKPKGKKLRKKVVKPFYNELDDFSNSENEDGSPKSDKSLSKSTVNTDGQPVEMFPKPGLDEVEYYFSELTAPKPNLFKGLIKEKVCEICEKAGRLVKCKGPCGDMFHLDCVEKQANLASNESFRGRKKKHRGKTKSLNDSESQSDDKSQESMSVDEIEYSIEDEFIPIVANVDDFEATLESKMKELMENPENLIYETHYNSDDDYDWDASVAIPRESAELKLSKDGDFRCNNCQKYETPLCFVCKSTVSPKTLVETRQKCNVAHCNKYYHVDCMEHWPQTQYSSADSAKSKKSGSLEETISCPRHVCHTCVCDDPRGCKTRFSSDKLAKCVRCPAVYHSFTKCLPAGTQILTGSQIICPRHYEHRPGRIPCHVNTRWCFICALGGTLICCEYCPTSFHAECLNIKPPEGGYMCEDCETGRLPLYGEMVWVKLGHYRWWPGLVLHPCDIPPNIMSCKHQFGEFVVRFFGQYDYYWVNRGRVFAFQEGDTGTLSTQKTKIDAAFHQAMEDAQRAFQILKEAQANEAESTEKELSLLPPHYVKLKVNKPIGSLVNWKLDTSDANSLTQCECNPDDFDPCGPDSHCLNRMLLTECGPTCRADERCNNRSFEKRRYPKLAPYRTPARGWGLKTLEDIRKGQFVIEYVGELIDEEEFRRRMSRKHEMRDENFYFLTLDKDRMIDAGPKGNLARFMNHCCEPNCETQKWTVLGDVRVGLFAMVDIPANSEVTFNYNLESAGIEKKQCMCGAKRCSGYIGAKPKQEERPRIAKRVYKKRKTNSVESPSTSQKGAKLKPIKKPKPKELTEIEKDLLIIKNATNGISSDSETDRLAAAENLDSAAEDSKNELKRKRVDFSADESACDNATESPIAKKQKPESDALSEIL